MEQAAVVNSLSAAVVGMGLAAAVGWLAAKTMHSIVKVKPSHAAVFCAISVLVSQAVRPLFEKVFAAPGASATSRFLGDAAGFVVGLGVSAAIATGMGFPITLQSGLILTISILAATILATAALAGIALTVNALSNR